MILTTAAVGKEYVQYAIKNLPRFKEAGFEIHLLTDMPELEQFSDYKVYTYTRGIWSYIEKILFTARVVEQEYLGALFVDADLLERISDEFLKEHNLSDDTIKFIDHYPSGKSFSSLLGDPYWSEYVKYCSKHNIPTDIEATLEWVYYIPANGKITEFRMLLEEQQPALEFTSIYNKVDRLSIYKGANPGIASGEGIALGAAAQKVGLGLEKFTEQVFKNETDYPMA